MGRLAFSPISKSKDKGEVPCTEAQLTAIFKDHDTNGDGKLSWSELDLAFKNLGSRWPWFRTEGGFRHADEDGNGFIDIETELKLLVAYAYKRNYIYKPTAGKV
ncbi:hypothetical protein I3760_15G057100 [Carya illinoinensis]|uniref:EF-hand domain-containing protein n=1 Tax=Carya illinoinensis TaxID=32201 RepID=A0A8T1N4N0_CARIL|nr:hypothetical protein I3760_15G057100 [Carya illinoinensis]KAG6626579.1 hypothetical protein CIPAW_15G059500 [Carya illinoinensis]KAG6674706.1 hypothetical protein I3842_15G057900 [Carya illinoinensis]